MNILIVRLGALGDIVHAVPAAAALRQAMPDARIDWLVEAKHREIVDLVESVDRIVTLEGRSAREWITVVRTLRQVRYDVAIDLQGLMKSAVLARASGARRVIGFSIWHLREKGARPFYSEVGERPDDSGTPGTHVIWKNMRLLRALGVKAEGVAFPFVPVDSPAANAVETEDGGGPFALINPGAAWPNKRWPAERFGQAAAFLRDVRGIRPVVLWGPGEEALAQSVVQASAGAARMAPPTRIADVVALCRRASLVLSGDTGPIHLAAAVGAPVVGIYGPTDPARNGPWSPDDGVVSRFAACGCHYDRRCHTEPWCLEQVTTAEVTAAIQRRLGGAAARGRESSRGA
jgi:lipopolysaccharide heptosyltransferase I